MGDQGAECMAPGSATRKQGQGLGELEGAGSTAVAFAVVNRGRRGAGLSVGGCRRVCRSTCRIRL